MKNFIMGMAITLFIILSLILCRQEGDLYRFFINSGYALQSAFISTFFVLIFLDNYYKAKSTKETSQFLNRLKLRLYSNMLLMEQPIKDFLKCDTNLLSSMTCKIGRIYRENGEIFEETSSIVPIVENLLKHIKELKDKEISQLKRFDYCICFIRLYENIKPSINQIIEMYSFAPKDNIKFQEILLELLFIKQNLEKYYLLIKKHINIKEYGKYNETARLNCVAILENFSYADCFTSVQVISKNLENLLDCIKNVCNEPEIRKLSRQIMKTFNN